MSSLNSVTLIGNLGADPELRFTPDGKAVCDLRLAMSDKRGGKETTEWVSVTVWEKAAEACGRFLKKGRQVCVQGRLQTQSWDDKKTGEKKYKTIVVAQNVVFLGGGKDGHIQEAQARRAIDNAPSPDEEGARSGDETDDLPF